MSDDKKKAATLIIGALGKPKEAEKNEMGDEIDAETALDAAAEDILSAFKASDAAALKASLRTFVELLGDQED